MVLQFFNPAKPIKIKTNISNLTIRAYLLQPKDDGKWRPIAYYSKKILSVKQNYNIINKELLAIMAALEEWYIYIKGVIKTTIYTNHKNLLIFTIIKEFNR